MRWPWQKKEEKDQVLLRLSDNAHALVDAEWFAGVLYASPHLPQSTRAHLLPRGQLVGKCYIQSWMPASQRTSDYWNSPQPKEQP